MQTVVSQITNISRNNTYVLLSNFSPRWPAPNEVIRWQHNTKNNNEALSALHSICNQPVIRGLALEIKTGSVCPSRSSEGTSGSAAPFLPVRLLSENSQQPFLSGAGDSPINTDIPPQRAVHAKRAPYPPGRSAGVYLQLGGYENRHGEKCHLPSPLGVLTPLCCGVGAAGGV